MAYAQRATINGVVLGPAGAPEPNITLIVTNSAGVDRRVVTDVMGAFVLGGLQPGPYRIRTDNDTFAPFSQDAIVLAAGQVFSMKIALSPRLPPAAAPTARAAVQGTVLGPDGVPAATSRSSSPTPKASIAASSPDPTARMSLAGCNRARIAFASRMPGQRRGRFPRPRSCSRPASAGSSTSGCSRCHRRPRPR